MFVTSREYGLDLLKSNVYVLLGEIQKTCFFIIIAKTTVILL